MANQFIEFSDIVYDIKDKLTDNEYLTVMNKLGELKTNIDDIVKVKEKDVCMCGVDSNDFCISSIQRFITCGNLQHTLEQLPILRNLIIIHALPLPTIDHIDEIIDINEFPYKPEQSSHWYRTLKMPFLP